METLFPWAYEIEISDGLNFIKTVLYYVVDHMESGDKTLFTEKANKYLSEELKGKVMTLAQQFRQEGLQEGIEQGIEQTAKRFIEEGVDPVFVAKVTQLPLDVVKLMQQ